MKYDLWYGKNQIAQQVDEEAVDLIVSDYTCTVIKIHSEPKYNLYKNNRLVGKERTAEAIRAYIVAAIHLSGPTTTFKIEACNGGPALCQVHLEYNELEAILQPFIQTPEEAANSVERARQLYWELDLQSIRVSIFEVEEM